MGLLDELDALETPQQAPVEHTAGSPAGPPAEFKTVDGSVLDEIDSFEKENPTPYQRYQQFADETGIPGVIGQIFGGPVGKYAANNPSILVDSVSDLGAGAGAALGGSAGAIGGLGAGSVPLGAAGAAGGLVMGAGMGAALEERIRSLVGMPPEEQLLTIAEDDVLNDWANTVGWDLVLGGLFKAGAKGAKIAGNKLIEPMLRNNPELDRVAKQGVEKFKSITGFGPDDLTPAGSQARGTEVIDDLGEVAASRRATQESFNEGIEQDSKQIRDAEKIFKESDSNLSEEIKTAQANIRQADSEIRGIDSFVEGQTKYPLKEINREIATLEKELGTFVNTTETGYLKASEKLQPLYRQKEEVLSQKQADFDAISKFKGEQEELVTRNKEALQQNRVQQTELVDQQLALRQRSPEFDEFEELIDSDFLNKIVKKGATPNAKKTIKAIIETPETTALALKATKGRIKPQLQAESFRHLLEADDSLKYLADNKDVFDQVLPSGKEAKVYSDLEEFFTALSKGTERIKPPGAPKGLGVTVGGRTANISLTRALAHPVLFMTGYSMGGYLGGVSMSFGAEKLMKAMANSPDVSKFMIKAANGAEDISKAEFSKFLAAMAGTKITVQAGKKRKTGVVEMQPTFKKYGRGNDTAATRR